METITFTNKMNQTVKLSAEAPYWLNDWEEDNETTIITHKTPKQDGETYVESFMGSKYITINFEIFDHKNISLHRSLLSKIFNPKLGIGLLSYQKGIIQRSIYAVPEQPPIFPSGKNRTTYSQKGTIRFKCPNPYWFSEEKVDQLVIWEGGLEFPLQLPTEFARMSDSKAKILLNEGDVETSIFIVFNGPATAPISIINKTTGEFIKVNQNLLPGERLEINTAFGEKRVIKILSDGSEENAFHHITLDSSFFNLIPGNNLIDYSTGTDYERAAVLISWRNRYIAV